MRKIRLYRIEKNEIDQKFDLYCLINNIVNKIKKIYYASSDSAVYYDYALSRKHQENTEKLLNDFRNILTACCPDHIAEFYSAALSLLIRDDISLFVTEIEGCPAHFAVAFPGPTAGTGPDWRNAWQVTGGRGLTFEDAAIGALCEAAECMSVWSRLCDDPLVVRNPDPGTGTVHLDANRFLKFSKRQLQHAFPEFGNSPEPLSPLKLRSLNHSNRFVRFQAQTDGSVEFVPGLCGLVGDEPCWGLSVPRLTSTNGTAVAEDHGTAADKAVFELIERDSVAVWWYNRIVRDRLPLGLLDDAGAGDLARWLVERERTVRVLDLASDLGVPVAAALSAEPDGSMIADGYAAGRTWPEAVRAAVLEMLQAEISLAFMQDKADRDGAAGHDAGGDGFLAETRRRNLFDIGFMDGRETDGNGTDLGRRVTAGDAATTLRDKGIDVLVADVTRPDIGVPAARAVSATLRDWKPRFAPGRLYDVPVEMGWLDRPNTEDGLNPLEILN